MHACMHACMQWIYKKYQLQLGSNQATHTKIGKPQTKKITGFETWFPHVLSSTVCASKTVGFPYAI